MDFARERQEVEQRLAAMQAALARSDRQAFAAALVYPVRVNTSSGCSAVVADQFEFLARYEQIVNARVRRAVQRASPTVSVVRDSWAVAFDAIWYPTSLGGFVFNYGPYKMPGLPCFEETAAALPAEFARRWRVTSHCSDPNSRCAHVISVATRLRFDLDRQTATFTVPRGPVRTCAIDRISEAPLDTRWPPAISHCPFPDYPERALTIYLDCRKSGESYVRQLHLLGEALATVGTDNHVVTYAPE